MGVEARLVDVEADMSRVGTFKVFLVGLSAAAARGMERRLLTAMRNANLPFQGSVLTVNFAPTSLPKEGPPLDVAVAAAVLASQGDVPSDSLSPYLFHGELSLDGGIRPVPGALAAAECAQSAGLPRMICAPEVAREAAAVEGVAVHAVRDLVGLATLLRGGDSECVAPPEPPPAPRPRAADPDLADVRGQHAARRALEIAAAGGHGLLLVGPPGSGKSMLARRLPSILPPMTLAEAVEVTRVHSAAGLLLSSGRSGRDPGGGLVSQRPFRAPHHGISMAGLLGGGTIPGPGEITLAHRGVLFLDEIAEFRRDVLESLRQPLEDGFVSIVRVGGRILLPCRFMPCAAMNPCACGYLGSRVRACTCTEASVARYRARLSGPLLDRLDLRVDVASVSFAELSTASQGEPSAVIRERACAARATQLSRQGAANALVPPSRLRASLNLSRQAAQLLEHAVNRFGLSARAHDRALRVALTIRDLSDVARGAPCASWPIALDERQVGEALGYRQAEGDGPLITSPSPAASARPA